MRGGSVYSRAVIVLDSGAEGMGSDRSRDAVRYITVLRKLFTPVVPLFTKQRNWYRPTVREGNYGPGGK